MIDRAIIMHLSQSWKLSHILKGKDTFLNLHHDQTAFSQMAKQDIMIRMWLMCGASQQNDQSVEKRTGIGDDSNEVAANWLQAVCRSRGQCHRAMRYKIR